MNDETEKKKLKCKREIFIRFMVTETERDMIYKRMEQAGVKNLRAYLLKQAIDGRVIRIELDSVNDVILYEVCRMAHFIFYIAVSVCGTNTDWTAAHSRERE